MALTDLVNAGLPQTFNLKHTHTHTHTSETQKRKITKCNKMRSTCNNTHNTQWLIIRM